MDERFWKREVLSQCEDMRLSSIGRSYKQITEEYNAIKLRFSEHIQKCGIKRDEISARYYQLENTIQTIDQINSGINPVAINWYNVLYSWQVLENKLCCYYDLQTLYYIVNNVDNKVDKLLIIDTVIVQLKARNQNVINADTCFEYLPHYREIIETYLRFVPTIQQQERIYSIPTSLTEKQLIALLGRLKDGGFVASEQTEEDFLNAFNPNATKQSKIKWMKRGKTTKGVTKTAMVNFVYLMYPELYLDKDKYNIVAAVFDIEPTRSDLTRGQRSEFYDELQQIVTN
ncbi:MAG: hypothetical protein E7143_00325 [Rikenellaceae bacterium]|nr:hypothetical protein [Rikenellaceae bacterium]